MRIDGFDIIAPHFFASPWTDEQMLGTAMRLWMHSRTHRDMPLHLLPTILLPALKHRQFLIAMNRDKPVFYLSWLNLNHDAEYRYLRTSASCLLDSDWDSGDRLWVHDWIAPFGHTEEIARLLQRRLFADRCARALYHRNDGHTLRVKTFQGALVTSEQASDWFASHPVAGGILTDHSNFCPFLKPYVVESQVSQPRTRSAPDNARTRSHIQGNHHPRQRSADSSPHRALSAASNATLTAPFP